MAITTNDGVVAGLLPSQEFMKAAVTAKAAGSLQDLFFVAGNPGAAAIPSPGVAGAALTSYVGQVPFPSAVGGENVYLAGFEAVQAANVGSLILYDRLWHNSGLSATTATTQTVNSVTLPARDNNGSTNGERVMVFFQTYTALTTSVSVSISYTNSAGTSGRTGTLTTVAASVVGQLVPMTLQAGDTGVRSIQSVTHATMTAGTYGLVMARLIARVGTPVANVGVMKGVYDLGLPRMYDNSVPFIVANTTGTAVGITDCVITYAQG